MAALFAKVYLPTFFSERASIAAELDGNAIRFQEYDAEVAKAAKSQAANSTSSRAGWWQGQPQHEQQPAQAQGVTPHRDDPNDAALAHRHSPVPELTLFVALKKLYLKLLLYLPSV